MHTYEATLLVQLVDGKVELPGIAVLFLKVLDAELLVGLQPGYTKKGAQVSDRRAATLVLPSGSCDILHAVSDGR